MTKMFGEKYYEDDEDEDELEIEANKGLDLKLLKDEDQMVEPDAHDYLVGGEKAQQEFEEELGKGVAEKATDAANQKLLEEGYDMWFCCDVCLEPIPELQFRFDCTKCDNYSMCMKCFKANTTHTHKFKKQKVPAGQGPPENHGELIAKAFMGCCECGKSLIEKSKRVYYCQECSPNVEQGDAVYWCKRCYETTEHEHKRTKLRHFSEDQEGHEEGRKLLDNLFQDYHDLDYEDVIGGGQIKTRFKYQSVPEADFGLTEEEILLLDDKALNNLVSIKHYRPFRHLPEHM